MCLYGVHAQVKINGTPATATSPVSTGSLPATNTNVIVGTTTYGSTTSQANTVVGNNAGNALSGSACTDNTLVGKDAGSATTTGSGNVMVGKSAGTGNTGGSFNTSLGTNTSFGAAGLQRAVAIGYNAKVSASNSVAIGGITGTSDAVNVGIGTDAPSGHLHLVNAGPESVFFSSTDASVSGMSSLYVSTSGGGTNNALVRAYSFNNTNVFMPALLSGLTPSIANAGIGFFGTMTSTASLNPAVYGSLSNGNTTGGNVHFITGVGNSSGVYENWECIRINRGNGFVGIHTRNAASAAGNGNAQALFHVNLTNPRNTGLNPLTQGIRFEGLPVAAHPNVVVIDAAGNLATEPVSSLDNGLTWKKAGNTITPADFIGTLNDDDFRIYTNNLLRARVTSTGSGMYSDFDFGANTFIAADKSAAFGDGNYVRNVTNSMAVGKNNYVYFADHSTVIGQSNALQNTTVSSLITGERDTMINCVAAVMGGTQNKATRADGSITGGSGNSLYDAPQSLSSGIKNNLQSAQQCLASGSQNNINVSAGGHALGYNNSIISSNNTLVAGDNNASAGSDGGGALGSYNQVNAALASYAIGKQNVIQNNSAKQGCVALGAENTIDSSEESVVAGEHNSLINGHGSFLAGGHNNAVGQYNIAVGDNLRTSGVHTQAYGSFVSNDLPGSLVMGFNGNRTLVLDRGGVSIMVAPASPVPTPAPAYNLEVEGGPTSSRTSNIAFHNLPVAPGPLPAVVVGTNGELYVTSGTYARPSGSGPVLTDEQYLSDIKSIPDAVSLVNQLQPKSYTLAGKTGDAAMAKQTYGLVAQDVEKVMPGLVTDMPGNAGGTAKGVQYDELIPVLVQAIKDQQHQIDELKAMLAAGHTQPQQEAIARLDVQLTDNQVIVLGQNVPNPCDKATAIGFYLPAGVRTAVIQFATADGKLIQTVTVAERGKGVVNVYTSELAQGVYVYTLVADGKVIDSKRMEVIR